MNRINKKASFGNEEYGKEELIAEMGAAMSLGRLGIDTDNTVKNNAAYIKEWIKAIKNDTTNKLVVTAAGQAEKAVNMIFNEKM